MPSFDCAIGTQNNQPPVPSYAPLKPRVFAKATLERAYPKAAPSEFVMLRSVDNAAAPARNARSIRGSGVRLSQDGSTRLRSGKPELGTACEGRPPRSS